eukprot:TRINITY_DN636_c0_g1_i1.p1 TRINITY_DN636_c0_g1~~TRINITY_DN636_c0_g1_i1.p1  ORF type:complete len:497 (-),score=121.93 TRINITY_DN636_c0_g1_i1:1040-2353(-)
MDLPKTCCYDDVGAKNVHLNIEGIHIDANTVAVSASVSCSPVGLGFDFSGKGETEFNVRLCYHDDPFGKGCSTLDNCKGNYFVTLAGSGQFALRFAAGAGGMLSVTSTTPSFSLPAPATNMCGKMKDQMDSHLNELQQSFLKMIEADIATLVQDILKYEPKQTIDVTSGIAVHWALDGNTGTQTNGLLLQGAADVLSLAHGSQAGPFKPRLEIPDATGFVAEGSDQVAIVLADSIFSNMMWAQWVTMQLSTQVNATFQSQNVLFTIDINQSPSVNFTSTAEPNTTLVSIRGTLTAYEGDGVTELFTANFTLVLDGNITMVNNQIYMQIGYGMWDAVIEFVHDSPFPPAVLEAWVYDQMAEYIPDINALLYNNPVPLPTPKSLQLSQTALKFGEGYALVTATSAAAEHVSAATLSALLLPNANMACPNLKSGHPSGCI